MDYNKACKKWHARERYEVDKTVEDKRSYSPQLDELEEGEFRKDEPFGPENLAHKDIYTSIIKWSSSAQVMVKRDQLNVRQSISPEKCTQQGSTANATVKESDYNTLEDQSVNLRRSTFHRKHSEKHYRKYSRAQNCFNYKDYPHVLKKIDKVCSERLSKLVLQHNGDRKEFNILRKKQKLEFFLEHLHTYKVCYERVIPTVRYGRNKLPKLLCCSLHKIFHKLTQPQLIRFVERQINDRNKEKRMKEHWVFEAKAGYLKKYFDETPLSYSKFEMEKSNWHVLDYPESEQLKYFDMKSLCSSIEAIASSNELSDSHTCKNIDVCDPILESPLRTNDGTKHQLSVAAADEIATKDSMPSQSNCAPAVEFSENVGTQVGFSSRPQNKEESVGRSCSSAEYIDQTLEIAEAMSPDSRNTLSLRHSRACKNIDVCDPILEDVQSPLRTKDGTKHQASVAAAHEIATIDSMPSQSNCAPTVEFGKKVGTQVAFPSPPQNMEESVGKSFSSADYTDVTLDIAEATSADADSRKTLSVPREKRRCTSVGGAASEGSCSRSQRNLPHDFVPNFHGTAFYHKEPQATRLSSVNVNQREEPDNTGRKDVSDVQISSVAQVTEQQDKNANLSTLTNNSTQLQHRDQISQNAAYPCEQSNGSTSSVRTGSDSPEAPIVQQQSTNQMMERSIVMQCPPEVRYQSDPTIVELNQVVMSCRDQTCSFSQPTQQRNINACSSSLTQTITQHPHHDQTSQTAACQYQPSGGNITLLRTSLDSSGESNVQQQSANQTTTSSTSEHMLESGLGSDPFTVELNGLLTLRDLMTKRHLVERQKIVVEREMEMAELKKKYDELFHNLEMETLQKKKDLQILQENLCKQQMLAETFQVLQASDAVVSCNRRGEPPRTDVPNQSSSQQTVRFPASATMHQPPQPAARSSIHQFLRQPSMSKIEGAMTTPGRSAATSTSAPQGVVGIESAGLSPAPHLRRSNPLPASRHGSASLER